MPNIVGILKDRGKNGLRETIPLHRELARGLERKLLKRLEQTGAAGEGLE